MYEGLGLVTEGLLVQSLTIGPWPLSKAPYPALLPGHSYIRQLTAPGWPVLHCTLVCAVYFIDSQLAYRIRRV